MDTAGQSTTNRAPVIALLCANAVSLLGSQLTQIALPWFVLQTTGSAARTGLTGVFSLLPLLIGGVAGGALVDRLSFRRASILSDLGSGLVVALVPLLYYTVGLAFWQILALVFLRGLLGAPGGTARQSLLPDLIALSGFPRERVNAAFQGILNLAILVGAPLAGLLIVALGTSNVLWLDAASFLLSALIIAVVVPSGRRRRDAAGRAADEPGGFWAGLRFLRRDRALLALVLSGTLANFFGTALGGVILPVYADRVLRGAVDLGLIIAAYGIGGLLGTVLFGAIGPRLPRRATFVGAFLLSAVPIWMLVALPPLGVVVAAQFLTGLVLGPLSPLLGTIMQERVPAELRGRVFGLITATILAAAPLGLLVAGLAVERAGLRPTLLAMAVAYLAIVVGIAVLPALRDLDRPAPDPRLAAKEQVRTDSQERAAPTPVPEGGAHDGGVTHARLQQRGAILPPPPGYGRPWQRGVWRRF